MQQQKIKDNFSQKDDGDAPSGSISAMLVDMVPEKQKINLNK